MFEEILKAYGLPPADKIIPINSGLINSTWKVSTSTEDFILQKINQNVFKRPEYIDENIRLVADYMHHNYPTEIFPQLIRTHEGQTILEYKNEFFRLFSFIPGSKTIDIVRTQEQAYQAAYTFGKFTRQLNQFPLEKLHITLPGFHDLILRNKQFKQAIKAASPEKLKECNSLIRRLELYHFVTDIYEGIVKNKLLPLHIIHHDTKISNVLFSDDDQAICPIDLDTIMPGYFVSDVGDMMRTYLSSSDENESDLNKISVRPAFYSAIISGYTEGMQDNLNDFEKKYLFYSGQFIIYMQALRFITDYLMDDVYYGAVFPGQNKIRAENQLTLLERYNDLNLLK